MPGFNTVLTDSALEMAMNLDCQSGNSSVFTGGFVDGGGGRMSQSQVNIFGFT